MSQNGVFKDFKGDSSEIIVDEALSLLNKQKKKENPSFVLFGTEHLIVLLWLKKKIVLILLNLMNLPGPSRRTESNGPKYRLF